MELLSVGIETEDGEVQTILPMIMHTKESLGNLDWKDLGRCLCINKLYFSL